MDLCEFEFELEDTASSGHVSPLLCDYLRNFYDRIVTLETRVKDLESQNQQQHDAIVAWGDRLDKLERKGAYAGVPNTLEARVKALEDGRKKALSYIDELEKSAKIALEILPTAPVLGRPVEPFLPVDGDGRVMPCKVTVRSSPTTDPTLPPDRPQEPKG